MQQKSAWSTMSKSHRYIQIDICLSYFAMGVYLILIGSALPAIKEEYQISYQIGGLMMSAQQIGYLVMGLLVSVIARRFGPKPTYLIAGFLAFIGLGLMMFVGNPYVLLFAMLLTGICKASSATFGNQISSNISKGDASLLNFIQAFFALGACVAPIIALLCGGSWRLAFTVTILIGVITLLHGMRAEIDETAYPRETVSTVLDLSFMKTKLFWLCALIFMCYLAVEGSLMGWMVTYFVDSGTASETTAQLLATVLWVAVLVGRFGSAWLSTRFRPHWMILGMTAGVIACFTLLMFSHTIVPMTIGIMGLGLFMAGMYGTTLGGSENLVGRYPMCMGMFIAVPGIGAAITPSVIGYLADHMGIRSGMLFLYIPIAILTIVSLGFARYHEKTK